MLNYRGLKGVLERMIVTEDQVDRQIDRLLERHTRAIPVTDRASQADDELVLDYAGSIDGVAFEGGTAQRQTLTLGSGAFIPGFEEQLLGHWAGEDVDVRVTFPPRYHAPALAGQEALFQCHIHEIRVHRPYAPDDTFAKEVGGCDSFEAFRARLRKALQSYADQKADEDLKDQLMNQLIAQCEGEAIDEAALERAVALEMRGLESQLARQGLTLDAYCRFSGKTVEQLRQDCLPDARRAALRQRIIAEIAQREALQADETDVTAAIQRICEENQMSAEQLSPYLDEQAQGVILRGIIADKAMDLVRDCAVVEVVER